MNSDNSLALFGNIAPVVTLMITQVMRVPSPSSSTWLLRRPGARRRERRCAPNEEAEAGRQVQDCQHPHGVGMEDGIERSSAMRARGYDCGARRTTYKRYRFASADAAVVAVVATFALVNAVLVYIACSQYRCLPDGERAGVAWWGYIPYALMMLVPVALYVKEWWLWRSLK